MIQNTSILNEKTTSETSNKNGQSKQQITPDSV